MKIRKILILSNLFLTLLSCTSCGQLSSGPVVKETKSVLVDVADVTKDNTKTVTYNTLDDETKTVDISILALYTGNKAKEILSTYPPEKTIPEMPETSHLIAFQLSNTDTLPVELTDHNGKVFKDNTTDYGFCYALSDGWYVSYLPNNESSFGIKIGNTIFILSESEAING